MSRKKTTNIGVEAWRPGEDKNPCPSVPSYYIKVTEGVCHYGVLLSTEGALGLLRMLGTCVQYAESSELDDESFALAAIVDSKDYEP